MAVIISTTDPSSLLWHIKNGIQENRIETWKCDKDGDFVHTPPQWNTLAWLRPRTEPGQLILNIIPPRNTRMSKTVYGVYHGRFIEMLLIHFDSMFLHAYATAMPVYPDNIGA